MAKQTPPRSGQNELAEDAGHNGHETRLSLVERSAGPRYQQVRQDLLAAIRRGEYKPGDRLPSENQICVEYGVSVTTARRALFELVKEGIVFRQPGVGTMVAPDVRQVRLALISVVHRGDLARRVSSPMGELVAGIGERAWEGDASFNMTGLHTDEAAAHLRRVVRDRTCDGVLIRCSDDVEEEWLTILEEGAMPYVVIKRRLPGRPHNCVVGDDALGSRLAVSHLVAHHHQRIGFVCAKPRLTISRERLAGYRQALQEHHLAVDPGLIRIDAPEFDPAMGYRAVTELLALPEPPTAIFVASDSMVLGAYEAIRDAGHQVGQDIAIVGYDDFASAGLLQPPLTTLRASYYDFGRAAAELLIKLIDGRAVAPAEEILAPTLIVRESAGEHASKVSEQQTAKVLTAGRLAGQSVVVMGADGPVRRAIAQRFSAEDATVSHPPIHGQLERDAARQVHELPTRTAVVVVDLGSGPTSGFDELLAAGQAALATLPRRSGGAVLLVATLWRRTGSGEVGEAAVRGGVAAIVRSLSMAAGRGVRVNAIVRVATGTGQGGALDQIAGTAVFFTSPEAAGLRDETVVIRR